MGGAVFILNAGFRQLALLSVPSIIKGVSMNKKYEHKNNTGTAFLNDKEGNERRPDLKGSAKIDEEDYLVACWLKKSESGKEYYSMSFEKKSEAPF